MIKAKYSIARRIGLYFLIMIGFASIISGISLGIMWSNKSDASLINVSGSLRMQSYRLLSEMDSKKHCYLSDCWNIIERYMLQSLVH